MSSEIQVDFDKRLRKLRLRKRWSQLKLETMVGMSPGTVSRIENKKTNPSKETLLRVAQVMELSLQECIYLFGIDCLYAASQQSLNFQLINN
jgi:transcriptional regulator with XRE-family HTH domain